MITDITSKRKNFSYRVLSLFIAISFTFNLVLPPGYAQLISETLLNLPAPGAMVAPSAAFVPVLLKGMTIHPDNPLQFDFIIDSGNTNFKEDQIRAESQRLVKYFLASMTIPKDDLWVNLSPYEKDRIVPDELGKTELGRDMLAQDYILKQLTASLMYPEKELGKAFWDKVYKQAQEKFGTTEIPVNTFNKVWILPETATVYEHGQTVYIVDAKLKVMLDSDYLAMTDSRKSSVVSRKQESLTTYDLPLTTQIVKEIILPEIEREVNEGQNFAPLRQIYHSLILAKWYKETIKNSLLSKIYIDKKKIAGVNLDDVTLKDQIYAQYMEAYKKGVFNYIKEDYDRLSNETIPRKYFSGGEELARIPLEKTSARVTESRNPQYVSSVEIAPQKDGVALALVKKKSSSPITPQEAEAMIKGKLDPQYHHLITDTHVQMAMAYEGDFEVVYHADAPEKIEITHGKRVVGSSSPTSSPIFSRDGLEALYDRELVLGFPFEKEYALVYGRGIFVAPLGSRDPKTAQHLNVLLGSQLVDGQYVLVGSFSKGLIAIMKLGFFANSQEAEQNPVIITQNQMSLNAGKFITSLSQDRIMMSEVWTTASWMTEEQWHKVMNDFAHMAGRLTSFKPVTPRIKTNYIDVSKNGMDGQIRIKIGHNPSSSPVTKSKKLDQSSSPVFMDEMRQRAAELGVPLGDKTRVAVFIGGKQILSGDYFHMFQEVVRGNFKFDLVYLPFVIEEGAADSESRIQLIKDQLDHNPRIVGAVVTRPWKEHFFVPGDKKAGVVNYIVKDQNGNLQRMATDGEAWLEGFKEDLRYDYDFRDKKIVIVGSGGSARELADALNGTLQGAEAKITFTDKDERKRTSLKAALDGLHLSYKTDFLVHDDLAGLRKAIHKADILINATGVGRAETAGQSPLLPHLFAEAKHDLIVVDLISNTDTQMLKDARQIGPEGIQTFNGRSMYIHGMVRFMKGWMAQANGSGQAVPSDDVLYRAIVKSQFIPPTIFQAVWPRFGYNERHYRGVGKFKDKIAKLEQEGKVGKTGQYDIALKTAIAFTATKVVPDIYVVDSGEETFGAEWMDTSFGSTGLNRGIYIEQALLDKIKERGDPADMLVRVFIHVLTNGSIVKKRKAQFDYAKAKFPRLIHHLLDPVNGGTKNIEQVLWDVRDNILGLATAEQIQQYLGDIGVHHETSLSEEKQQEIRRHAEELADIAESALHKIAINALNKTIDLSLYQRIHLKEHEMTAKDKFSVGMLAYAANPPTFAHALVAALKAMAESNSDIFFVSATFADFRKPWLRLTYEKRQAISKDFFWMLSGGLIKVMDRLPHDEGLNGEEKVLPILNLLDGAGAVKVWYGAGDDHFFAFAPDKKTGKVKFEEIVKEGDKRNYNDFLYYVQKPGYQKLLGKLLENKSMIPTEHISFVEEIVRAKNPEDLTGLLQEGKFFPVLDTIGKLWLIQEEINARKNAGEYSTDFTLGMINVLRDGVMGDVIRDSLKPPTVYNPGASFEIAATFLRNGVAKLIQEGKIDLVAFEAMSKDLLKELLSPTTENREYLYSLVRLDKGLIAAKAAQTLFPLNEQTEKARHQDLRNKLQTDLSLVVPNAVVDESSDGNISKITVSDAGQMNDVVEYMYSVHNGLYHDGRGKETVLIGNIKVEEHMSKENKDAIIKAIENYVRAYNYADGKFVQIQDVLIRTLVHRDKQEKELQAGDADVIMIPGNDDLNVYRKALDLLSQGIGKHLLISGGVGRLREDIKKAADDAGFVNIEKTTEAEMIRDIMVQMAQGNPQWRGLVDALKSDDVGVVILDKEARYTVENFEKAREKLRERGLLGARQQVPLKLLYIQKPLQQLRTAGQFNSVFIQDVWENAIKGISFTTDYEKNVNTPSDIVAEYFRIVVNYQKKREVEKKKSGDTKVEKEIIGDWEWKKGLESVPANDWAYALLLFDGLTQKEKQHLAVTMRINVRNMGIDDRTVLYKNLPPAAKTLVRAIYGYGPSSPSTLLRVGDLSTEVGDNGAGGRTTSSPVTEQQDQGIASDEQRATSNAPGGIDMNSIDLDRQGGGVDIQFDPAELQDIIDAGIDGFAPVIINITPLPSVLPLLGLEPAKKEEQLEISSLNKS